MAVLSEVVELLKRWDRWKRIDESPERIDALERRITELEARLQRAPGEACPSCGALEFRVTKSEPTRHSGFAHLGARDHHYKCQACGFQDTIMVGSNSTRPRR
jgi:transposase-like protein